MATATSAVDICNLAMNHVSGGSVLSITSPSTSQEIIYAEWYDVTRRSLLRKLPWNFAKKRVSLARNAVDPTFSYADAYDLPSDFIRLLTIGEVAVDGIKTEYEIENGQILINNEGGALNIIYIFDQTMVTKFDAIFVELLALMLAKNTAFEITGKNTVVERLNREIAASMSEAFAIDGQERPPRRRQKSNFLTARRLIGAGNPKFLDI